MKRHVAVIDGSGQLRAREEDVPELKDNEVLIKVATSLISPGTEMGSVKSRREKPDADAEETTFGYANAGEIVEVKGDARGLGPGMRVAAMGGGGALHGSYACVPVNLVTPIPERVSFADASYACLGATALQAVRRTVPQLGEYGIILGQGIVGNLAAQLCQLSGARVIAWEGIAKRMEISRECGISHFANFKTDDTVEVTKVFTKPYGADFAIMAFGGDGTPGFKSALSCMKVSADGHQMGRIVLVGGCEVTYKGGASTGNVDVRSSSRTGPGYHDSDYEYGRDYPNAFIQFTTQRNLREIISLIAEGRLHVNPMTTHVMPLESVNDAADLLLDHQDQALGIVLEMPH